MEDVGYFAWEEQDGRLDHSAAYAVDIAAGAVVAEDEAVEAVHWDMVVALRSAAQIHPGSEAAHPEEHFHSDVECIVAVSVDGSRRQAQYGFSQTEH